MRFFKTFLVAVMSIVYLAPTMRITKNKVHFMLDESDTQLEGEGEELAMALGAEAAADGAAPAAGADAPAGWTGPHDIGYHRWGYHRRFEVGPLSECMIKCEERTTCQAIQYSTFEFASFRNEPVLGRFNCFIFNAEEIALGAQQGWLDFQVYKYKAWQATTCSGDAYHDHSCLAHRHCGSGCTCEDTWLGTKMCKKATTCFDDVFDDHSCVTNEQCGSGCSCVGTQCKGGKLDTREVKLNKYDRVRMAENFTGQACNRWGPPCVGDDFLVLKEALGTINSMIDEPGYFQVSVIFDRDVTVEVWLDHTYLVKDDPPLKGARNDTLIEAVMTNFPQAEDMISLRCPITTKIFRVPVLASDGRTYEKSALMEASRGAEPHITNFQINSLLKALIGKVFVPWRQPDMPKYQILRDNPPALGAENLATFKCPLSLDFFRDPVVASDGHTYERDWIQKVLQMNPISPATREPLLSGLAPNQAIKSLLSLLIQRADLIQEAS